MSEEMGEFIRSGRLWSDFCARLGDGVQTLTAEGSPDTIFDRAEGARYLSRLVRLGLEMYLENGDVDFPTFYRPSHETAKLGGDNPDNLYLSTTIAGDRTYRLRGNIGTVTYLSVGAKANRYAEDGTMVSTGELVGDQFKPDANGDFEIIVSVERPSGGVPWLPLRPDATVLHVRQTFLDRSAETPATIRIERISPGPTTPAPTDPQQIARRLMQAADFVVNSSKLFTTWATKFMTHPNQMRDWGQEMFIRGGGDPQIFYVHGYWTLKPGEMLVIDTEVPECEHWNIQVNNWWMESLDYRYHRISVNKHSARLNEDGTATIVISPSDPGFGNWLPTVGHDEGFVLLRWVRAEATPIPCCRVVPIPPAKH